MEGVNHPEHYQGKRECIEEIRLLYGDEAAKGFCRGNYHKYKTRAGKKEGESAEKDLAKAEWYLDYLEKIVKAEKLIPRADGKSLLHTAQIAELFDTDYSGNDVVERQRRKEPLITLLNLIKENDLGEISND